MMNSTNARKFAKYSAAVLLWGLSLYAAPAFARTKLQGIVERGGQSIVTNGVSSATRSVRTFPGSTITVCTSGVSSACNGGAGNLATLYSNSTGTPLSNPFHADSAAAWFAYLDDGTYDILFSPSSFAAWTLSAISIGSNGTVITAPPPSGGDDYATLQALINTYTPQGIEIVLRKGVYLTSQELQLLNSPTSIRGAGMKYGSDFSVLRATASMRSVVFIQSLYHRALADITIDANQQATSAILLRGSSLGRFENVEATNGKIDGWSLDNTGGNFNDASTFANCWGVANGTLYLTTGISGQYGVRKSVVAGTATITSGSMNVVIAGGPDLTTFGFRKGDLLRVGSSVANSFYGLVSSVTATTFVLQANTANLPTQTLAGQNFAIGLGDGFHETHEANNNINTFIGGLWRGNASCGMRINGLFGDTVIGPQFDANGMFSISSGDLDNANAVFGLEVIHSYTEVDGVRASFFLGNVVNTQLSTLIGPTTDYLPANTPATGTIRTPHGEEYLSSGTRNNFVAQVKNNGGTLQVRFLGDLVGVFGPAETASLAAAPTAYTNTPTVDAVTPFGAAGIGIVSGSNALTLDTTGAYQAVQVDGRAALELNETGTSYTIVLSTINSNVNGTAKNRLCMYLYDLAGANQPWTAITAGKTLGIRVDARIKK